MPRTIELNHGPSIVATEKELLDFANAIRQAGGAGVIEALLPSEIGNPDQCLIATALNFGCSVETAGDWFADGCAKWVMRLPVNLTDEQLGALDGVKGVRLRRGGGGHYLTLPRHIGNAALAFDEGVAFQDYAKDDGDRYQ